MGPRPGIPFPSESAMRFQVFGSKDTFFGNQRSWN